MIEIIRVQDKWVVTDRAAERIYGRYASFEMALRHKEIMEERAGRKAKALTRNPEIQSAAGS